MVSVRVALRTLNLMIFKNFGNASGKVLSESGSRTSTAGPPGPYLDCDREAEGQPVPDGLPLR